MFVFLYVRFLVCFMVLWVMFSIHALLFSLHHVCVLDMYTSLCYCASLNTCSDDHLLCYVIIIVISLWLFWCMIKLLICFTSCLLDRNLLCYIILVLLLLALPWGSNVFCASVSGYRYICSKFITASRFRYEWVLPSFLNSRLSLESVLGCFVTK